MSTPPQPPRPPHAFISSSAGNTQLETGNHAMATGRPPSPARPTSNSCHFVHNAVVIYSLIFSKPRIVLADTFFVTVTIPIRLTPSTPTSAILLAIRSSPRGCSCLGAAAGWAVLKLQSAVCLTLGYNNSPAVANNREVMDTCFYCWPSALYSFMSQFIATMHVTVSLLNQTACRAHTRANLKYYCKCHLMSLVRWN